MCLYTQLIDNKKYQKNAKNGGLVPPFSDTRTLTVPRKCGNCIECRKQKAREWQIRLSEDIKENKNGKFITLTFNTKSLRQLAAEVILKKYERIDALKQIEINDYKIKREIQKLKRQTYGYGLDNEIATIAIRKFNERWRKETGKAIRHWAITELGTNQTEHIHIHAIMWTDNIPLITKKWQYGYVWDGEYKNEQKINYVNQKTCGYITKYMHKMDQLHKHYIPKMLTSAGIGKAYINSHNASRNKYNGEKTILTYKSNTGHEISLPKYYKDKLYTEEEKEKLWIIQMNKGEKYICGVKTKTEEEYQEAKKHYHDKNIQLGYTNNKKNWEKINEEQERRIKIQKKRGY